MHLKSLELMGFKSFGRKTVFDFQPGVTAIIGPNGSGKSNVCDAIRWVLGEQSARALRGTKMSEVIFAGSSETRPAAFSQVKLVLDNEDRLMPIDFAEIAIGRQLFRSGESNYYFNGTKSLLGDIKEMLMDTGIGKDGYSVIGQGDIDDIIFQRIQSRRALIEEAAGITKFKHRKNHTLQKLDHTRANITRVKDIINEIELQLGPLAEQAEKTKKYQILSTEIRALEIDLVMFDLSQLYNEHENIDSMRKGLLVKIAEIQAFLAEIEAKKTSLRSGLSGLEEELNARQGKIKVVATQIDEIRDLNSKLKEDVRSHTARRERINEELLTLDTQIQESIGEITEAANRLSEEEANEIQINGKIEEVEVNRKKVQAEFDGHLKEVAQDQQSSFEVARQLAEKKNRILDANKQIAILARGIEKGGTDIAGFQALIDKDLSEQKRLQGEEVELKTEIAEIQAQLEQERSRFAKADKELTRQEEEFSGIGDQMKIHLARRNMLEELRNREGGGISRGAREALALKDQGLNGIFGIVGDLIKVPRGFETAFETALGGSIQDVITRDAETAQKAIATLKERKLGRATFLPLDLIQPPPRVDKVNVPGCRGVALDLIEFDPKFYSVMNHLLGRILIFDDLDRAVEYSRRNRNYNRIVTIDGDVVRSSGAMTGGADSGQKGGGLLARKRELEELEEKVRALESKEKKLRAMITTLKNERSTLSLNIRNREDRLNIRSNSQDFVTKTLKRIAEDLVQRQAECAKIATDHSDIKAQHQRLSSEVAGLQNEISILESQNQGLVARLQELSGKESAIRSRLEGLNSMLSIHKTRLVQIAERKKGLKKEIDSAGKRRQSANERKERAEAEVVQLGQQVVEAEGKLAAFATQLAELDAKKAEVDAAYEDSQKHMREASKELDSLDHAYQSRARMEDSNKNKLGELDIKMAEVKTHIKNKESILTVEYQLNLEELAGNRKKYENKQELTDLLAGRKLDREKLEPVNPLAIEDYEKAKERHTFFIAQTNDLTDAATSLEQVIAEIEKISTERFMSTFQQISAAFSDIFQILFPGGEGHLKLSTPEDVLNSNVEIACRLPGKKLTTIELFSGGEKALISIALLFAILQVKPPAFCVLDEIEASLDEANVRRFCRLLRSFADKTQFLVITHNKETMQAVDVIYGITLEKTGVSRQISIRLEDTEKIREFTTPRAALTARAS